MLNKYLTVKISTCLEHIFVVVWKIVLHAFRRVKNFSQIIWLVIFFRFYILKFIKKNKDSATKKFYVSYIGCYITITRKPYMYFCIRIHWKRYLTNFKNASNTYFKVFNSSRSIMIIVLFKTFEIRNSIQIFKQSYIRDTKHLKIQNRSKTELKQRAKNEVTR